MEKSLITEVASQTGIEFEISENPANGTITLAFAPITKGEFYDPNKSTARPIPFARKFVRELIKYNQHKAVVGLVAERGVNEDKTANSEWTFTFDVDGGTLPTGLLPKKYRPGKAEELVALETAIPGVGGANPLDIKYFNSSVNEGLVIDPEGTRIPFGLQLVVGDDGIEAKVLKSSAVGGKKSWSSAPVDSVAAAIALVEKALEFGQLMS